MSSLGVNIRSKISNIKNKIDAKPRLKKSIQVFSILAVSAIGVATLGYSLANDTPPPPPSASVAKCGERVQNYSYQVPFGKAAWNVPVCDLPRHAQSDDYAKRFYNYARGTDPAWRGRFNVNFAMGNPDETFSRGVYYTEEAEGQTAKVQVCGDCTNSTFDGAFKTGDRRNMFPDTPMPWHRDWPMSKAGDNEAVVIDRETGKLWSISQAKPIYPAGDIRNLTEGAIGRCGILDFSRKFCVYTAKLLRDHDGNLADYRTFEGSTGDRGVGISYYATLLTPEEVEAGEIRHALGMGIFNTSFHPPCTPEQLQKNDPKVVGKTCGTAVAPAAKFEWGHRVRTNDITLDQTVPEGMRFALKPEIYTDEYIDSWIKSQGYTGQKARTAKIIIVAMRDYGVMAVDTGGVASIQVAGGVSPQRRAHWNKLGITDKKDHQMLWGLFNEDSFYVVEPPINQCIDGPPSKFYCKYSTSTYPNAGVPVTNPVPPNQPPTTPPSNPGDNPNPPTTSNTPPKVSVNKLESTYRAPATISLTATATDSDGIEKVEFFNGSKKLKEERAAPYTHTLRNLPAGGYTIYAVATDKKGASTTSAKQSFNVQATASIVPTKSNFSAEIPINIAWNSRKFEFHQSAVLSWSASSGANGIKHYTLLRNGQKIYEGSSRNHRDFEIDDGQKYKYEVYATDNKGVKSATSSYEATVKCYLFGWICRFE